MAAVLLLVAAYLLGSIPAAYIAGRAVRGIDLRQHGSGNLGATNVYRVLGAWVAGAVLLFDAAKGFIPTFFFPRLTGAPHAAWWAVAYGVAAILGHARPAWLLWRGGGKGVATAAGVFLALAPLPVAMAIIVWAAVLAASGYVSLASLVAAVVLPIALGAVEGVRSPAFALSVLIALFVFWTHRANIRRLPRGEEHRFGRRAAT